MCHGQAKPRRETLRMQWSRKTPKKAKPQKHRVSALGQKGCMLCPASAGLEISVAPGGCPRRRYTDSQNPAVLSPNKKKSHGPGNQVSPQCPKSRKKRVFGAKIAWRSPPLVKKSFLEPFLTPKTLPFIGTPQNSIKIDKFIEKTVFFIKIYRFLSKIIGFY